MLELQTELPSSLAEHVETLGKLFQEYGFETGSRDDLRTIARQLAAPSRLTDAAGAAIRSIVYREPGVWTEADLLQLLAAASGGLRGESGGVELDGITSDLKRFFGTALRAFERRTPDSAYVASAARRRGEPSQAYTSAPVAVEVAAAQPSHAVTGPEGASVPADTGARTVVAERVSTAQDMTVAGAGVSDSGIRDAHIASNQEAVEAEVARMLAADRAAGGHVLPPRYIEEVQVMEDRPAPEAGRLLQPVSKLQALAWRDDPLPAQAAKVVAPEPAPDEDDGEFPQYGSVGLFRREYRTLWIVGICGVLLGLLLGVLLRSRGTASKVPTAEPAQTGAVAPVITRKPSPYGAAPLGVSRASAAVAAERESAPSTAYSASSRAASAGYGISAPLPVRVAGRSTTQAPTARFAPEATDERNNLTSVEEGEHATGTSDRYAATTTAVYLSASGVMASNLVVAPAPAYPTEARDAGVQGKVVVQALIGRDGHVLDAHVMSGDRRLRGAALEAVERWRYRPFVAEGRTSEIETVATLDFRLLE